MVEHFIQVFAMAAACSPDCRYYAALSEDGRLRVWQTDTNVLLQEYTPDLHLSAPPICLAWILLSSGSATKKAKKRKSSASDPAPERHESAFVALGTTGGKILIYSIAQAKVETVLANDKSQELREDHVTSMDWSRDYGLYSSTGDNCIYEWDIQNASVNNKYNLNVDSRNRSADKITAIKIIPHSLGTNSRYIVTASCQLRLWSLTPVTVLRTMVGHSGAVSSLARAHFVNSNKCYVASCTKTERLLSFWDVTVTSDDVTKHMNGDRSPTKKQRRKSSSEQVVSPACNFVMEDAPRCVDLAVQETEAGSSMNLAVVTRSGVLHFYGHVLNGPSTKPIKPTLTLHVSTEEAVPMPLQCCKFTAHGERDAGEMLVGYEPSAGRLRYERVIPETQNKTQVLIRKGPPVSEKKKKGQETGTRGDEGEPPAVTYVETGAAVRKRVAPGSKVEVPMESRLANLALGTSRKTSAVNESLTKLLAQGLHSKDKTLILTVLQQVEPAVATRTIAQLPATYIPALLEQLTEMASRKTSQCKAVCVWLTALLRVHSAYLLGTLNTATTSEKFSRLLAVLTQRRSHLCQLLNLKGRLDLIIAQQSRLEKQDIENEAVINYIDTSSDSESELEMEVAANSDDSNEGWEDEESVREASDNDQ